MRSMAQRFFYRCHRCGAAGARHSLNDKPICAPCVRNYLEGILDDRR